MQQFAQVFFFFIYTVKNCKSFGRSSYAKFLFQEAPPPPWKNEEEKRTLSSRSVYESSSSSRIVNSHSAPSQGLNALASAPRLPRAQNPTITLLQKARGQRFLQKSLSLFSSEGKLRGESENMNKDINKLKEHDFFFLWVKY